MKKDFPDFFSLSQVSPENPSHVVWGNPSVYYFEAHSLILRYCDAKRGRKTCPLAEREWRWRAAAPAGASQLPSWSFSLEGERGVGERGCAISRAAIYPPPGWHFSLASQRTALALRSWWGTGSMQDSWRTCPWGGYHPLGEGGSARGLHSPEAECALWPDLMKGCTVHGR